MNSRSRDTIPARIYPWWLLLVGFALGVLLTFFVMYGRGQTVTVYRDAGMPDDLFRQATQFVHEATLSAPMPLDPLFRQATAIVIEATAVAERQR